MSGLWERNRRYPRRLLSTPDAFPDRAARPRSGPAAYWSRVRPTAAAAVGDVGHRAHQPVVGILHPARRRPGDEIRANAIGCWCQARENAASPIYSGNRGSFIVLPDVDLERSLRQPASAQKASSYSQCRYFPWPSLSFLRPLRRQFPARDCVAEEVGIVNSVGRRHGSLAPLIWFRTVHRSTWKEGNVFNVQPTPVSVLLNFTNRSWT